MTRVALLAGKHTHPDILAAGMAGCYLLSLRSRTKRPHSVSASLTQKTADVQECAVPVSYDRFGEEIDLVDEVLQVQHEGNVTPTEAHATIKECMNRHVDYY